MTTLEGQLLADRDLDAVGGRSGSGYERPLTAALLLVAALAAGWALGPRSAATSFPGDSSPEAGFARDMGVHHQQAVQMADIIRDRTDNPLVDHLAREIVFVQQAQIGQLQSWQEVWGLTPNSSEPPMAWMGEALGAGQRMAGMASTDDVQRLVALSGQEADEQFLRLMIAHHRGGVARGCCSWSG